MAWVKLFYKSLVSEIMAINITINAELKKSIPYCCMLTKE